MSKLLEQIIRKSLFEVEEIETKKSGWNISIPFDGSDEDELSVIEKIRALKAEKNAKKVGAVHGEPVIATADGDVTPSSNLTAIAKDIMQMLKNSPGHAFGATGAFDTNVYLYVLARIKSKPRRKVFNLLVYDRASWSDLMQSISANTLSTTNIMSTDAEGQLYPTKNVTVNDKGGEFVDRDKTRRVGNLTILTDQEFISWIDAVEKTVKRINVPEVNKLWDNSFLKTLNLEKLRKSIGDQEDTSDVDYVPKESETYIDNETYKGTVRQQPDIFGTGFYNLLPIGQGEAKRVVIGSRYQTTQDTNSLFKPSTAVYNFKGNFNNQGVATNGVLTVNLPSRDTYNSRLFLTTFSGELYLPPINTTAFASSIGQTDFELLKKQLETGIVDPKNYWDTLPDVVINTSGGPGPAQSLAGGGIGDLEYENFKLIKSTLAKYNEIGFEWEGTYVNSYYFNTGKLIQSVSAEAYIRIKNHKLYKNYDVFMKIIYSTYDNPEQAIPGSIIWQTYLQVLGDKIKAEFENESLKLVKNKQGEIVFDGTQETKDKLVEKLKETYNELVTQDPVQVWNTDDMQDNADGEKEFIYLQTYNDAPDLNTTFVEKQQSIADLINVTVTEKIQHEGVEYYNISWINSKQNKSYPAFTGRKYWIDQKYLSDTLKQTVE